MRWQREIVVAEICLIYKNYGDIINHKIILENFAQFFMKIFENNLLKN